MVINTLVDLVDSCALKSLEVRLVPKPTIGIMAKDIEAIDATRKDFDPSEGVEGIFGAGNRSRIPFRENPRRRCRERPSGSMGLVQSRRPAKARRTRPDIDTPATIREPRPRLQLWRTSCVPIRECLKQFRGVDLCTDELGVPLWVLKPLVKAVRDCRPRRGCVSQRK